MIRLRAGITAALLVALVGLASPAEAVTYDDDCHLPDYTGRAAASLCWPIPAGTPVVIDGPPYLWRLRVFAEQLDSALQGLDVRSAPCGDIPGGFCLRVVKLDRGSTYQGLMQWRRVTHPDGTVSVPGGTITLNTWYRGHRAGLKRAVAAHEFMHALGFRHHGEPGAVGRFRRSLTPTPSSGEWAALQAWYGQSAVAR